MPRDKLLAALTDLVAALDDWNADPYDYGRINRLRAMWARYQSFRARPQSDPPPMFSADEAVTKPK